MITRHEAYDLSKRNTFGMKVSCRLYVEVTEPEDLLTLDFDALPQPLFVMGGGSNLLFTSDFPGTVLHLATLISPKTRVYVAFSMTCSLFHVAIPTATPNKSGLCNNLFLSNLSRNPPSWT